MNKKYLALGLTAVLLSACGGGGSSTKHNDGKGDIDLRDYAPKESITKTYESIVKEEGKDIKKSIYSETIEVTENIIITDKGSNEVVKNVYTDMNVTTITIDEGETETTSMYRHVDIGDTFSSGEDKSTEDTSYGKRISNLTSVCQLESKDNRFEKDDNIYNGDILKIKCVEEGTITYEVKPSLINVVASDFNGSHDYYDLSYVYYKKDIGEIASIDENCIPNKQLIEVINDKKKDSECAIQEYENDFMYNNN